MIGVAVVLVITVIIVAALNAGDDEEAEEGGGQEEIPVSRIEPAAKVQLRIDPVLTLQKSAVGAGLSFSF